MSLMHTFALVLALFFQQPQDEAARIRALIDKLGSDFLQEREDATVELRRLGKSAEGELTRAAADSNAERAARAKGLLRRLAVERLCSPALLREFPDAVDRIVRGGDAEATALFIEAGATRKTDSRLPLFAASDLAALAPAAIRGATDNRWLEAVAEMALKYRIQLPAESILDYWRRSNHGESVKQVAGPLPPGVIAELVSRLNDEERRSFALRALRTFKVKEALPALKQLALDKNPIVRSRALRALGAIRGDEAIPELIAVLRDPEIQETCVDVLLDLGAREAEPDLLKLLAQSQGEFRASILRCMGELGLGSALPHAISILKGPEVHSGSAIEYLRSVRSRDSVPVLLGVGETANHPMRGWAVHLASELDPAAAVPAALKLLSDPLPLNRVIGASCLARGRSKQGQAELVELLKGEDQHVRAAALFALARSGSTESMSKVLERLESADSEFVLRALTDARPKMDVKRIRALVDTSGSDVQFQALQCIEAMGEKPNIREVRALLNNSNPWTRVSVIQWLGRLEGKEAVDSVIRFVNLHDSMVCAATIDTMARVGAWDTRPQIEPLLGDLDAHVRRRAAAFLAQAGSTAGRAVFFDEDKPPYTVLNALRNPGEWKRLVAIGAPKETDGSGWERLTLLAAAAGLKLEGPASERGVTGQWLHTPKDRAFETGTSVAEALEQLCADSPISVVVEKDRLRILSHAETPGFWRDWLKQSR